MHPKKYKQHHQTTNKLYREPVQSYREHQSLQNYQIPKNKCQKCYDSIGRYIIDCYCIFCEKCFETIDRRSDICQLCGNKTKGNCLDAKNQSSINKISHLFGSVQNSLGRTVQVFKFQHSIANKYCKYLEDKIKVYQKAVQDLIRVNPNLQQYFKNRFVQKDTKTQKYSKNRLNVTSMSTNKPNLHQIPHPQNTNDEYCMHHRVRQYGGSGVSKAPNLNYSTALKSSKRPNRLDDDEPNIYQRYNRK